jgi:hypothetical protein
MTYFHAQLSLVGTLYVCGIPGYWTQAHNFDCHCMSNFNAKKFVKSLIIGNAGTIVQKLINSKPVKLLFVLSNNCTVT